ncbi:MAG: twin-arginine translocase subunit TatC [Planctomycetales bacterium]|nr:twin-arginine translocase subunit TatC [Planctomycetales bacterium]
MVRPEDEADLDKSKMSFGEHLEELRSALFKSIAALTIGFLLGLLVGRHVVNYIQGPLRDALEEHYRRQAEQAFLEEFTQGENGVETPDDPAAAAAALAEAGLSRRELYLSARELVAALAEAAPDADSAGLRQLAEGEVRTPRGRDDLIRIPIYQPIEDDPRMRVVALSVQEGFMVYVKASLIAGAIFSSPFTFFYIWDFVAAGLYRHERRYIYIYLPISLGLFLAGAALAFYVAFDYVLDFLFWFNEIMGVDPDPRLSEWVSFVFILPPGFGISFQLPIVMLLLERIGVFSVDAYLSKWRVAIVVICTLSMFLTPADPGSMIVMAVPLIGLYFGGVLMCKFMPGRKAPPAT